jgi:hypothetical protein
MSNNKLAQLNIEDKEVYNSNINYHLNTIKVIIECDGDKEIRWYTLDTINSIK